ncbi:hypothetical protein SLEP1_g55548 [Rubroshorea leprosula]|uniref:Uncharacterized protein n=1 Tax=Rubroshorea leprosula TaxID=152421 RepID=A0AAV5MGV8_9ROSI|nr:hypothetical protein SLEP1_g55548 [Rubroshorea leprosula]
MGTVEPSLEELLEQKKRIRSPLVPVGGLMHQTLV